MSGGRLKIELLRTKFCNYYQTLLLAGRLIQYEDAKVDAEELRITSGHQIDSDDPHVIALARISGARLLFSRDIALHSDFCSRAVLSPRGRVHQNRSHRHLLRGARQCRRKSR